MNAQLKAAIFRAVIGGVVAAGVTFFLALAGHVPLEMAGILAGGAFFSTIATRGTAEGWYDGQRALTGASSPADVSPIPTGGVPK